MLTPEALEAANALAAAPELSETQRSRLAAILDACAGRDSAAVAA